MNSRCNPISSIRTQSGFTVHEALVSLGIIVSLSALASGAASLLARERVVVQTNALMGDLALARSEAIKRQQQITLCQSQDGQRCSRAPHWHEGWVLFVDIDEDRQVDANEAILNAHQAWDTGFSLRLGNNNRNHLYYKPSGAVSASDSFFLCGPEGSAQAKAIIIYYTGRPRLSTTTSDGKPIRCP